MPKFSGDLKEAATKLAGSWASVIALGSFLMYLLGYLIVRFHLTVLGIGTDLTVVDERYLFAGAKFVVYLLSTIPIFIFLSVLATLLVLIVGALISAASWVLHKVFKSRRRLRPGIVGRVWRRILFTWSRPGSVFRRVEVNTLAFVGIALSVALIQFVMRQCLYLNDLLLATHPPTRHWVTQILLDETGNSQYYYFSALVAGTLINSGLLATIRRKRGRYKARFMTLLLSLLVCVQFLFLPINYGILVFDKAAPRVIGLGGQQELVKCEEGCQPGCQEAWLVWEGAEGQTYLVREWDAEGPVRKLVTLPLKDNKRTEIVGYDPIISTLLLDKRCL